MRKDEGRKIGERERWKSDFDAEDRLVESLNELKE